jgi:hypothetical protein
LLGHCCEGSEPSGTCLSAGDWSDDGCYALGFAAIRACFTREVGDAGALSSWDVAVACTNEYLPPLDEWVDVRGERIQVGEFPWDDNPLQELVECAIGSLSPETEGDDAGVPLSLPLNPRSASCAYECFAGWR